jgi:hypothetical protein
MEQTKVLKTANMKEYKKAYYQKNKERINKKKVCEICGSLYNTSTKWRHFKSKKHRLIEMEKKIKELENKITI